MQTHPAARILFVGDAAHSPSANYDVKVASRSDDAIGLAAKESFDVIMVDFDAQEVDGLQLLKALGSRNAGLPFVLLITENRTNELTLTAAEFDVALLDKPASSADLERAVSISNRRSGAREDAKPNLPGLTKHFDDLVARMRTPEARAASDALFTDAAETFGDSALAAVKNSRG